jgi:hypothetical protein
MELVSKQQKQRKKESKRNFMKDVAKVHPIKIVHPTSLSHVVLMTHKDRLNFILSFAKLKGGVSRSSETNTETRNLLRRLAREVFGGTQEPVVRVRGTLTQLLTNAGGTAFTPAMTYNWGTAIDQASWAQCFDEVKVLSGDFKIYPLTVTEIGFIIFCVDYDNATVLASQDAALAYDTYQIWNQEVIYNNSKHHLRVPVVPQGIPDKSWIDTTDTTTVSAYLKGYAAAGVMATPWFDAFFEMEVKFRQIN